MKDMTVTEMAAAMNLEILVEGDGSRTITGGYCGDLLSWVMGRAKEGNVWSTVLLAEDSPLDDEARSRAEAQDVPVLRSGKDTYSLAVELGRLLER